MTSLSLSAELSGTPDLEDVAESMGLHYVSDREPGIRRLRHRSSFRYVDAEGQPVRDERTLQRIRSLVIPPAWTDVWICSSSRGHIQATGVDARGRKQYRYHDRWREVRDSEKFGHLAAFGRALPAIRAQVQVDIARPGLPRERVIAAVVELLDQSLIRIGNELYARENKSFGLTSFRNRHLTLTGTEIRFQFRGKSGAEHAVKLRDRRVAAVIKRCQELPGQHLFQYLDDEGQRRTIRSEDVNAYLRSITDADVTAKDFRTWWGTVIAAVYLRELGPADSERALKANLKLATEAAAKALGNTIAVCRKCYIHPAIVEAYERGEMIGRRHRRNGMRPEEAAVLWMLEHPETMASSDVGG
ncbi:MAG TPA: DNA topoisomerase IB [Chloroflexota bacterium]|jgi:DNA topoisomerase-1|nr:DNA topoisomerase IB [Chloroflexota bacterium]